MRRRVVLGRKTIEDDAKRIATLIGAVGAPPHGILSPTHDDAVTAAPVRGGLAYGNATPEWDLLTIGADGTFIRSDGTDLSWATIQTGDLPALRGTPALTFDTINADGAATTYIATDATIALFDATNPVTIQPDATGAPGAAGVAARRDHVHAIIAVAPTFAFDTGAVEGIASSFVRSDATLALFDVTVPTIIEPDAAAATGSVGFAARRDHTHGIVTDAPTFSFGTAAAEGTATSFVRSDATLALFDVTVPTTIEPDAAAATGSAGVAARRDHTHGIVTEAPSFSFDTAAVEGTSTSFVRADATLTLFDVTVPADVGAAAATGSAGVAARRDHVHGHGDQAGGTLHDVATTLLAGFMSATDKTKLDGIEDGAAADHGNLAGLTDDDHTQYLLADGTRALTGDWDAGGQSIRAAQLIADMNPEGEDGGAWYFPSAGGGFRVGVQDGTGRVNFRWSAYETGGTDYYGATGDIPLMFRMNNGQFGFYAAATGTKDDPLSWTNLIIIDDGGNTLQVAGNITVTGTVDGVDVASHASRHIRAGGDEVDGDQLDIDWNPTNYTPATTPAQVSSVDHLTAHLYGIDQCLTPGASAKSCRVYRSTTQSIPSGTWTAISFSHERWDDDSIWAVGNPTRLTCKTAGSYIITSHVELGTTPTSHWVSIRLNGATVIAQTETSHEAYSSMATMYKLAVNDYVEVMLLQTSGVNQTLATGANYTPEFGMGLL